MVNDRSRSLHPQERGPVSIVQDTVWASWYRLEGRGKFPPSEVRTASSSNATIHSVVQKNVQAPTVSVIC